MSLNSRQSNPVVDTIKHCRYQTNNDLDLGEISSLDMRRWSNDVEVLEAIKMLREVKEKYWDLQQILASNDRQKMLPDNDLPQMLPATQQTTNMIKKNPDEQEINKFSTTTKQSNNSRGFSFEPESNAELMELDRWKPNIGGIDEWAELHRKRSNIVSNDIQQFTDTSQCPKILARTSSLTAGLSAGLTACLTNSPISYKRLNIPSGKNNHAKRSSKNDRFTNLEVRRWTNEVLSQNSDRFEEDENLILVSGSKPTSVPRQCRVTPRCRCAQQNVCQSCTKDQARIVSQRKTILLEAAALIKQNVAQPQYLVNLFRSLQQLKTPDQLSKAASDIKLIAQDKPELQVIKQDPELQVIKQDPEFQVIKQDPELQVIKQDDRIRTGCRGVRYTHSNIYSEIDRCNQVNHISELSTNVLLEKKSSICSPVFLCDEACPNCSRRIETDSQEPVLEFTNIWEDKSDDVSLGPHSARITCEPHSARITCAQDIHSASSSVICKDTNQRDYTPQYYRCEEETVLYSCPLTVLTTDNSSPRSSERPLTFLSHTDIAKQMEREFQGDELSAISFLENCTLGSELELAGDWNVLPPPPGGT